MRRAIFLAAVCGVFSATGCVEEPPFIVVDDAGAARDTGTTRFDTGGGSGLCRPGQIYCNGAESYQCTESGQVINRQACTGAALTCVAGIGCRVCTPQQSRCNPDMAQQIQTCSNDGMRWINGATCAVDEGQSCTGGVCADRCSSSATGRSYLGCDYWPTITANSQLDSNFEFAVVLSNPQSYAVRATITGGALQQPRVVELTPGSVQTVPLPWVDELVAFDRRAPGCRGPGDPGCDYGVMPARSTLRRNGAYHVHSNGPIAAYQFNPLNFSRSGGYYSFTNDASLLLPQGVLTNRYIVSTWPNWSPAGSTVTAGGFATIVAVSGESTMVTVRPTSAVAAGAGVPAIARGATGTFSLQPGDAVQLVGSGAGDLSGTVIEATNPIAVFVGHDCTNVPTNRPACDHLEEQLFPNETWGRDYFVSGLRDRGTTQSVIRIISQAANNTLTFDPPSVRAPATLGQGQVLEFATSDHFRVQGTQAFLVSQYMIGQGPATLGGSGAGDPAMVFEVPVQQYRTSYDFLVPSTYQSNFINVVAPMGTTLTMDDQPFRGSMSVVSGYSIYTLPIQPGAHRIRAGGNQAFGIKVYGIASYTSYMYPGGLDLQLITPG
ncbi:MAG: IgGFc-binding protein [Myxococcales bacterium]|nr:IgGFc-binding protein [Myxococcales bacterium]